MLLTRFAWNFAFAAVIVGCALALSLPLGARIAMLVAAAAMAVIGWLAYRQARQQRRI